MTFIVRVMLKSMNPLNNHFSSANVRADNVRYNFYTFDIRYQQSFTDSQPFKVEFEFDGVNPNDVNGYAPVLNIKLVSLSSDGQRHFDIIQV